MKTISSKSVSLEEAILNWALDPIANLLANESLEQQKTIQQELLESEKVYVERIKGLITEELKVKPVVNEISEGFEKLKKALSARLSMEELKELEKEIKVDKVFLDTHLPILNEEGYQTENTFQKLFSISNKTLEYFYEIGTECYKSKDFRSASNIFRILTALNPFVAHFWVVLSMALQSQTRYDEAIQSYAMAATLDCTDPSVRFYCAECLIHKGAYSEAIEEIDAGIEIAQKVNQLKTWEKFAQLLRQEIK